MRLAINKQATAEAVANAKVTIESLIAEAEARSTSLQLESNERLWNGAGQLAQPPIRYF
jgi:hypothetical protein